MAMEPQKPVFRLPPRGKAKKLSGKTLRWRQIWRSAYRAGLVVLDMPLSRQDSAVWSLRNAIKPFRRKPELDQELHCAATTCKISRTPEGLRIIRKCGYDETIASAMDVIGIAISLTHTKRQVIDVDKQEAQERRLGQSLDVPGSGNVYSIRRPAIRRRKRAYSDWSDG